MVTAGHAPFWRRLRLAMVKPDDNPFSVRARKYLTGTHLLLAAGAAEVAPTPREQIWQRGPVRLWRYTRDAGTHRSPVILAYAMILRPYILDLVPGRSVVESLLEAGHDVWLVDWGEPGPADSAIGLDSYIDEYLRAVVATVTEATGSDAVTLLGHCQGGTFAAIYAALHPDEVRNLILLAAPIDFVPSRPSAVGSWSLWSRQRWYDPRALLGPNGNVPVHLPGRAVAAWSAPVAIAAPWLGSLRARMATSEEGRVWLSACQWVDDSPPLSGTAWVQWLAGCYQRNDLVHGRMRIGDRQVLLGHITASQWHAGWARARPDGGRSSAPADRMEPRHVPPAADYLQDDFFPHATVSPEQEPTMSSDQNDPNNPEALEDDPIDQMEREADGDAEQAWEESDVEEGEAPTG